jgi:plastocyanin
VLARFALVAALLAAAGCGSSGGGGTTPSPTPAPTPTPTNTITITAAGVSPSSVQISAGSRVLFINSDARAHNMTSDPHPEHDQCPEINQVGFLSPGQSHETGNLVTVRTCGFHDHDDPNTKSLQGSIVIK